ncbi:MULTISPECIES: ROK family glucokinase [Clostridium]|jgi:glucokinase|uniref:ROK family glucokinase n=2 Tax=Clostridium TaxID=1485 RepID=UPI000BE39C4F|nr:MULTISPECIES: ROK family glucokinase [Clostridium]MBU6136031.1 ROK family glucokinase [Clostridium tertium]MDB1933603.1 ROK family glucokinase [Clostridium tertium]MDB1936188.1 ROK family glucokinase [Clostridium tertium]MDU2681219.1 ROK family glucokinase [Clostridium sp.]MDU8966506.1 ROK family glucokinase [Clostridium sp.]
MKSYLIGVDIGGTTVKLGLFTPKADLVEKWEITTRKHEGGKYILPDIVKSIEDKLEEKNIDKSMVEGIGLGVPGPINNDGIVKNCVNLGWKVFNIEKNLSELIKLPVKAGNDANVAALGEMWKGGGEGYKNIIMITLGTGVGGGIIIDGMLLPGVNGSAGEIGHINVCKEETESCGCGKKGCLEQYASATGIVNIAKKLILDTTLESILIDKEKLSAKDIFDAAKLEDGLALKVINKFGEILGRALANIACILDPEVFVIGGGVSKAGELLLETVKQNYEIYAFHSVRKVEFKLAKLDNDAGIYGAAKLLF